MAIDVSVDHVVIAATDLEQGTRYICDQLGVDIPFGGVHETMGTHNHLMRLGNAVFLEVIAINPNGTKPSQPRWYGLDDPYVRASIAVEPALVGWVVNTRSIEALCLSAAALGHDFGKIVPVSRGDLKWKFGLPQDGRLLAAGMLPYIIEWGTDIHPAVRMANTDCKLVSLEIEHPQTGWLHKSLQSICAAEFVSLKAAETPRLYVSLDSPKGLVTLSTPVPRFN